jgi:hypothetical protein
MLGYRVLGTDEPACPLCGMALRRVKRRIRDRVLSVFRPVHRFRCEMLGCGWHGLVTVISIKEKIELAAVSRFRRDRLRSEPGLEPAATATKPPST